MVRIAVAMVFFEGSSVALTKKIRVCFVKEDKGSKTKFSRKVHCRQMRGNT